MSKQKTFRVAFVADFNAFGYSGGRYHSLMMASALAEAGFEVDIFTKAIPAMHSNFVHLKSYPLMQWKSYLTSGPDAQHDYDFVVCIPDLSGDLTIYAFCLELAIDQFARLVMLDFESVEWFNIASESSRNPSLYFGPKSLSKGSDLILSSTSFGSLRARESYTETYSPEVFKHVYPGINSGLADQVPIASQRDTIFFPTRFRGGSHKNGHLVEEFIKRTPPGQRFVLMADEASSSSKFMGHLVALARTHSVDLVIRTSISDLEKFEEYRRSRLMVFPTSFEGYGYPIVEAIYSGADVLAYDLPVFVEITGGLVELVPSGDQEAILKKFEELLSGSAPQSHEINRMPLFASKFSTYGENLERTLLDSGPRSLEERLERDFARKRALKTIKERRGRKRRVVDVLYARVPLKLRNKIHSTLQNARSAKT